MDGKINVFKPDISVVTPAHLKLLNYLRQQGGQVVIIEACCTEDHEFKVRVVRTRILKVDIHQQKFSSLSIECIAAAT